MTQLLVSLLGSARVAVSSMLATLEMAIVWPETMAEVSREEVTVLRPGRLEQTGRQITLPTRAGPGACYREFCGGRPTLAAPRYPYPRRNPRGFCFCSASFQTIIEAKLQ